MEIAVLIFLGSGLFLGWSLGANDAANVFGTAVGTRMVRFGTAAIICSIFVILGAVLSGAGAAQTLGKLGTINALPGAFMAAFAAALTVYLMTKFGLPVSTSQAIVGAIIGWNLFSGFPTDAAALVKIVGTWVACPLLAGMIGALLFKVTGAGVRRAKFHLLRQDAYTRFGLIVAGAIGAYSLGANNIANVMGVFVSSNPFTSFEVLGWYDFSGVQQLFLLGGLAIAVGVFTYSKRVMLTVGGGILPLSPVAAWVVVVAHSIVLLLFASEGLEGLLAGAGLPTIPLVPVSSSQAVVGAVIGIGLLKGGKGIRWRVLASIGSGWVTTPVISCLVCFISLFFLQNVFNQRVYDEVSYVVSRAVTERLREDGIPTGPLEDLADVRFDGVRPFRRALDRRGDYSLVQENTILGRAQIDDIEVIGHRIPSAGEADLSRDQVLAIRALAGKRYRHRWQLAETLAAQDPAWRARPAEAVNKIYNKRLGQQLGFVVRALETGRNEP